MLQLKEEDKILQKQLNEEDIGNICEKRIHSNDSKEDPKSWKKNGGTH